MKIGKTLKEFLLLTLGAAIVAAAVFFFMLPSHVSVGSGAALAMVLSNFIPLSVSTITLLMNVLLLLIGLVLIGPEFGVKTVYCSVLMPVIMGVFELFFPNFHKLFIHRSIPHFSLDSIFIIKAFRRSCKEFLSEAVRYTKNARGIRRRH